MSIDYTHDYSNHVLLDNKPKYEKLYKLSEAEASDVSKGDLILLKTPCGKYGLYIALSDADEEGTLSLAKYSSTEFIKFDADAVSTSTIATSSTYPCDCGC